MSALARSICTATPHIRTAQIPLWILLISSVWHKLQEGQARKKPLAAVLHQQNLSRPPWKAWLSAINIVKLWDSLRLLPGPDAASELGALRRFLFLVGVKPDVLSVWIPVLKLWKGQGVRVTRYDTNNTKRCLCNENCTGQLSEVTCHRTHYYIKVYNNMKQAKWSTISRRKFR